MRLLELFTVLLVSLLISDVGYCLGEEDDSVGSSLALHSDAPTLPARDDSMGPPSLSNSNPSTPPVLAEPISSWVQSIENDRKVKGYSFGPDLVNVIKNRGKDSRLFDIVIDKLSKKEQSLKKKAEGGYFVEFYPDEADVFFESYAGSGAK